VVVGAIEPTSRKPGLDPAKQSLMVGVHPERDLGLTTVATEVAFTDEDADEKAAIKLGDSLFHRQVSRETSARLPWVVSPSSFP